jgi:hypothetical protein
MDNNKTAQPTYAELQAKLAEMEKQLAEKNTRAISFKIGEDKGAIGIYGLSAQGFPISLYYEQLDRFFTATTGKPIVGSDTPLGKFVAANEKYMSRKAEAGTAQETERRTLRLAESHGIVSHPSEAQKAKNKAKNSQTT